LRCKANEQLGGKIIITYLRSLFARFVRRAETERELEQELASHIYMRADDLERLGLTRAEAKRRARIEFGGHERFKEECREAIAGNFIDVLLQDLRFGSRILRKSPGFAAIAIVAIALGIGATTAIFTVGDATLLEPLPDPQSEQLVSIQDNFPGAGTQDVGLSEPEWEDLQRSGIFEFVSPTWFARGVITAKSEIRHPAARGRTRSSTHARCSRASSPPDAQTAGPQK
jgi:hypothetical protein